MRRFLITNATKFTGSAEIVYNPNGVLCKIDLTQCIMPPAIITRFKQTIPATIPMLLKGDLFSAETTIVEADLEVTFQMFWLAYNNKINKKRAEAIWNKLTKTKQVSAWAGIAAYDRYLKKEQWRNKADPDTYLRNEMWESEWR